MTDDPAAVALLESVEQAVIATNSSGEITYLNRFAERLYGWTAAEAIGRPITDLAGGNNDHPGCTEVMERIRRGEAWAGELPVRARDGREFSAFVIDAPIVREGQVVGIIGTSVDAAAASDSIRAAENRNRAIVSVAPDPIIRIDATGRYVAFAGPPELRLFGESHSGARLHDVLPQKTADRFVEAVKHALAERAVATAELEMDHGQGTRIYEARMAPAGADEVIAVIRDVTESRRFQRELYARVTERTQQIAELSQRLLGIQEEERRRIGRELHDEIGQLMTGLSMLIKAARRTPDNAAAYLEEAAEIVLRATEQVRDLSFHLVPALAERGLAETLRTHAAVVSQRSGLPIDVAYEVTGAVPVEIGTAAFRIVQEALTNVIRHARASRARVAVSSSESALCVQIEDDGLGFVEASAARTTGLTGMRERARIAGGRVVIGSLPGQGTRVFAEFPLVRTAE